MKRNELDASALRAILPVDYCTYKQAASRVGVSYDALRKWAYVNDVPHIRVGQTFLVRMSDLASYTPYAKRNRSAKRNTN